MIEHIEIQNNNNWDEEYIDLIAYKPIQEMIDPVLTPQTGHIYDREDIVNWIIRNGTDPIDRDKALTRDMLVPGRFIKQIYQVSEKRHEQEREEDKSAALQRKQAIEERNAKNLDEMQNKFMREHQKNKKREDLQVKSLKHELHTVKEENHNLIKENKLLEKKLTISVRHEKKLKNDNKIMKETYVNPIWSEHGLAIENKLKKGSTPERTKVLRDYSQKVKACTNDHELQKVVNNTKRLQHKNIREPRFFGLIVGASETYKVAMQFKDEINKLKGW